MKSNHPCPNCGEPLDLHLQAVEFNCEHCGEALLVSSSGKVILAKPIQTYLRLGIDANSSETETAFGNSATPNAPKLSNQRKLKAAELAHERIGKQRAYLFRGFVSGLLFVVFGGLSLLLALLRQAFVADDWLNVAGITIGIVFVPLGSYFTVWFSLSIRSLSRETKDAEREI